MEKKLPEIIPTAEIGGVGSQTRVGEGGWGVTPVALSERSDWREAGRGGSRKLPSWEFYTLDSGRLWVQEESQLEAGQFRLLRLMQ